MELGLEAAEAAEQRELAEGYCQMLDMQGSKAVGIELSWQALAAGMGLTWQAGAAGGALTWQALRGPEWSRV